MRPIEEVMSLLGQSQSIFHVVKNIEDRFLEAGFIGLSEGKPFELEPGKKYFVKRNDSSGGQNTKMPQKRRLANAGTHMQLNIAERLTHRNDAHDSFAPGIRIGTQQREEPVGPVGRQLLERKQPAERFLYGDGDRKRTIGTGSVVHVWS